VVESEEVVCGLTSIGSTSYCRLGNEVRSSIREVVYKDFVSTLSSHYNVCLTVTFRREKFPWAEAEADADWVF
jgi:hypothetical protein